MPGYCAEMPIMPVVEALTSTWHGMMCANKVILCYVQTCVLASITLASLRERESDFDAFVTPHG